MNTNAIQLSPRRFASVETSHYGPTRPVIVVYEDGRRTPGQWFAETLIERTPGGALSIDYGANWSLTVAETLLILSFACGVVAAAQAAR